MWLSEASVAKESVAEGAGWASSVAASRAALAASTVISFKKAKYRQKKWIK
jgi:hypothetical protein